MQRNIEQTALPVFGDLWNAFDGGGQQFSVFDDAHLAAPLGDQHPTVRKKCEPPRMIKALDDFGCADLVVVGVEHGLRAHATMGNREKNDRQESENAHVVPANLAGR